MGRETKTPKPISELENKEASQTNNHDDNQKFHILPSNSLYYQH